MIKDWFRSEWRSSGTCNFTKVVKQGKSNEDEQRDIFILLSLGKCIGRKAVERECAKDIQREFYFNCLSIYVMRGGQAENMPKTAHASLKMDLQYVTKPCSLWNLHLLLQIWILATLLILWERKINWIWFSFVMLALKVFWLFWMASISNIQPIWHHTSCVYEAHNFLYLSNLNWFLLRAFWFFQLCKDHFVNIGWRKQYLYWTIGRKVVKLIWANYATVLSTSANQSICVWTI